MSTLSEFDEIFRRLPPDIQELINMIRAGAHRLTPRELMRLIAAIILAGGPRVAIERILLLMTRLGWLAPEVLAGALAEAGAGTAAAGTAAGGAAAGGATTGGATAGGTTAGGATAGGTTAGGATAGGGAAATAITVATVAAIAVLVVEIISLISAITSLRGKAKLVEALDELNARVMQGIRDLRAARSAGQISQTEFQQQLDEIIKVFTEAQKIINARNNELQDALDDNILINIGEWFYGETSVKTQDFIRPDSTGRLSIGTMGAGQVMEHFAALVDQPANVLQQVNLADLRCAIHPSDARMVRGLLQEQWMERSYHDAYRNLCLRAARYFSTPSDAETLEFWQSVYADEPANAFARKQAVLACFCCDHAAAWDLVRRAAEDDRDPAVRVFAYEILGSITRRDEVRTDAFLALAADAARSGDHAARLGSVCGLSLAVHLRRPQGNLDKGRAILKEIVSNEKNGYIAGTALAALTGLVPDGEIGDYLPTVVKPAPAAAPSKAEMLLATLNRMAALGDMPGFVQLVQQPGQLGLDDTRAAALFAGAPFTRVEDIRAVEDIDKSTFDAMVAGLNANLMKAGVDLAVPPAIPVLRAAKDRLLQESADSATKR
jgi:hypothetical protein